MRGWVSGWVGGGGMGEGDLRPPSPAPEIQSWGEGPTSRESPYHDSCTFEALTKQNKKKTPLTTVAISTDQCIACARAESVQGVRENRSEQR